MVMMNQMCLINAIAISMVIYIIITMPYVLDTVMSNDDYDFELSDFVSYMNNSEKKINANRMLRGFNVVDDNYVNTSIIWVNDTDNNINIVVNNNITYQYSIYDKKTIYVIDNNDNTIVYAMVKNYCVLAQELQDDI